jgi:hypothetical protein
MRTNEFVHYVHMRSNVTAPIFRNNIVEPAVKVDENIYSVAYRYIAQAR